MRQRTSAQAKRIEAELQARREAAYRAVFEGRECGLDNHGAGGCSDPYCPTRK